MNTRRSPRNQERLWRALGGAPAPRPAPPSDEERLAQLIQDAARPTIRPPARAAMRREIEALRIKIALRKR